VREPDGLAMSSRNALLAPGARSRALALSAALGHATRLVIEGERSAQALLRCTQESLRSAGVTPEYVALVEPTTLEPIDTLTGEALLAIAARIDGVRLIDNAVLRPAPPETTTTSSQPLPGEAIATCNA
jgi:pantoate--beta-alanine ligase